jgi:response regulator of citrate/malate metabolism
VEDEVAKLNDDGVNAEAMGQQVGVSRTTARRYLEFLVSKGTVKPSLVYGSVGRPERLYFQVSSKT